MISRGPNKRSPGSHTAIQRSCSVFGQSNGGGISRLLGSVGFALLQGAALAEGRKLLAETDQLAQSTQGALDADIVATNKALLLLAVGQPDVAIQVLASVGSDEQRATAAAYTSVALSRLGRNEEAATLNAAEAAWHRGRFEGGARVFCEGRSILRICEHVA